MIMKKWWQEHSIPTETIFLWYWTYLVDLSEHGFSKNTRERGYSLLGVWVSQCKVVNGARNLKIIFLAIEIRFSKSIPLHTWGWLIWANWKILSEKIYNCVVLSTSRCFVSALFSVRSRWNITTGYVPTFSKPKIEALKWSFYWLIL